MKCLIFEPLITRWEGNKRVLVFDFVFYSERLKRTVTVPAGFKYDGESVPRWVPFLYALLSNRSEEAAAGHDWAYSPVSTLTREEADFLYLDLQETTGAGGGMRYSKFAGVRTFGWMYYKGQDLDVDEEQPMDQHPGA